MKRSLLIFFAAASFFSAQAGEVNPDIKKGDYYFSHRAYKDAIECYEKVVKANPRRKDAVLYAHLGDCYRLLKNYEMAAQCYGKSLTAIRGVTKEMKFHYGEVLMNLQRYAEAAPLIKAYSDAVPTNRRAANMLKGCEQSIGMMKRVPEGLADFLTINTNGTDFGPAIYGERLAFTTDSMIHSSGKVDKWTGRFYYNIYSVKSTVDGVCGNDFELMSGKVNTKFHDGTCVFTADGKQMYFTRTTVEEDFLGETAQADEKGTVHLQIMIASDFDPVEKKFKKVAPFPYNSKSYSTAHPALSPDGNTLIFTAEMPGGEGATDLYITRKNDKGEWDKPVNMGKTINTDGDELFPVYLNDRTISFVSNGHPGFGGLDVFYTTTDNWGQKWSEPENAGIPVNSSYDDMSLAMYSDGQNGYFASNRPADKRSDNVYHFFKQKIYLVLNVVDSFSHSPVNDVTVAIAGKGNYKTDDNGYVMDYLVPRAAYSASFAKPGYVGTSVGISTKELTRIADTLFVKVVLLPEANISYRTKVLDEATHQPIENPLLVISKDGSKRKDTVSLETGAEFMRMLESGTTYHINAIKENYFSNEKHVDTKGIPSDMGIKIINDTIYMCKLMVGAFCQVENIYYDYDKSAIRPDAKPALDKLLKLMKDYPKMKVQLNSHTDCRGTDEYNDRLSQARANSVIRYLASKGIKKDRLTAKGFGEMYPVVKCENCENCDEGAQQQNRRTEFQVLEM